MLNNKCHTPAWRNMYVTTLHGRSESSAGTSTSACTTSGNAAVMTYIPTLAISRPRTPCVTRCCHPSWPPVCPRGTTPHEWTPTYTGCLVRPHAELVFLSANADVVQPAAT